MKRILAKYFPGLGKYKRFVKAWLDTMGSARNSYAQHGEDKFFLQYFKERKINADNTLYVDIGCNHPSDISNTYLLYRHGFRGILIDANKELCRLCERFRPDDITLNIGVGDQAGILDFYVSKTPVLSTFMPENTRNQREIYQHYRVPILRAEDAISNFKCSYISLLSIDVEGMNPQVLIGCGQLLHKTLLLCIEYDDLSEKTLFITQLTETGFQLVEDNGCNLIFENKVLVSKVEA